MKPDILNTRLTVKKLEQLGACIPALGLFKLEKDKRLGKILERLEETGRFDWAKSCADKCADNQGISSLDQTAVNTD
jgi:hypothetical protein